VVWVGVASPETEVGIKPYDVFRRELTIRGTYVNPFAMERALALLDSGRINWEAIVKYRFPLKDFERAWVTHRNGAGLKVCVQPMGAIGEIRLPVRSRRSPKPSRLRVCLNRRIWRPDFSFTFNLALQQLIPYARQLFHLSLRKPFEEPPTHPSQVGRGRLR